MPRARNHKRNPAHHLRHRKTQSRLQQAPATHHRLKPHHSQAKTKEIPNSKTTAQGAKTPREETSPKNKKEQWVISETKSKNIQSDIQSGTYAKLHLALPTCDKNTHLTLPHPCRFHPNRPRTTAQKSQTLLCSFLAPFCLMFLYSPLVSCVKPRATFCARTPRRTAPFVRHTSCTQ